jgi:hypothetical protein
MLLFNESALLKDKQKITFSAGCCWLMPITLATQEAEIRRITGSKPAQANSSRDPILKTPISKKG